MNEAGHYGRGICRADKCRKCLDCGGPEDCEMLNDLKALSEEGVKRHFEFIERLSSTPQAGCLFD